MQIGLQQHLAQGAIFDVLQGRHNAGVVQAEFPALVAAFHGAVFGGLLVVVGQTGNFRFAVDHHFERIGGRKHVVAKEVFQFGEAAVDFFKAVAFCFAEFGPVAHKIFIGFVQKTLLHRSEVEFVGAGFKAFETAEEIRIHVNLIAVGGFKAQGFGHEVAQFGRGVGRLYVEQHRQHFFERQAALVECQEGVFESRFFAVIDNGLYLSLMCSNGFFDGRQIVLGLDLVEWRGVERLVGPRKVERIFHVGRIRKGIRVVVEQAGGLGLQLNLGAGRQQQS